ncbi:hypothetical protein SAMN05444380_12329 [Thermophagus xiamenensis]|uniref:Uncharacterized protein n=1 Tax=Thermophagus xiamenensis TaxID=385682 RepID=A0A1I2ENC2_9BACT|nr:hypothetical protein SAMN05444380_12329 [Thermophagus xiamenensis]
MGTVIYPLLSVKLIFEEQYICLYLWLQCIVSNHFAFKKIEFSKI